MHNGDDSRITEKFITHAMMPALDAVERHWRENWRAARAAKDKNGGRGTLVIVGKRGQNKFFSNGAWFAHPATRVKLIGTQDLITTTS